MVVLRGDLERALLRVEQHARYETEYGTMFVQYRLHRTGLRRLQGPVQRLPPRHVQGDERQCELHALSAQLQFVCR
jgi:hypothetical protein